MRDLYEDLVFDGSTFDFGDLQNALNAMRADLNTLRRGSISLCEYGDISDDTGYMDALLGLPKQLAAEGGGTIRLDKGPRTIPSTTAGSAPIFGTYLAESIPLYANVVLDGGFAYRRNALVADPGLARNTPMIRLATATEAGWSGTYPAEADVSVEANMGLIGCCIDGNEELRPQLTANEKDGTDNNLAHHGYGVDLVSTLTNGPQTQLWGMNDTRGKFIGNLIKSMPESGVRWGGRGEWQIAFNQIADCRVFGAVLDTFDNHTAFNVVNNCGHSGLIIRSGNNRIGTWKIWFIGYLPAHGRYGTRDALYDAIAEASNGADTTLENSYVAAIYGNGIENVEGVIHGQDTYGHGLLDQGKRNEITFVGDMIGGMRGGDFSQAAWAGDSEVRALLHMANGNYSSHKVYARTRDHTKYVASGGTTDLYGALVSRTTTDPFKIEGWGQEGSGAGLTGPVAFSTTARHIQRAYGQVEWNGRKIWDRTYVASGNRITSGTGNTLNLERGRTQIDITGSSNVGGSIANARAESFRHTLVVRRTPAQTGQAVVTGTFVGGTTLTVNADYATIELEFVFNPGETVGSGTGRWMIVGGSGNATIS